MLLVNLCVRFALGRFEMRFAQKSRRLLGVRMESTWKKLPGRKKATTKAMEISQSSDHML